MFLYRGCWVDIIISAHSFGINSTVIGAETLKAFYQWNNNRRGVKSSKSPQRLSLPAMLTYHSFAIPNLYNEET